MPMLPSALVTQLKELGAERDGVSGSAGLGRAQRITVFTGARGDACVAAGVGFWDQSSAGTEGLH